MANTNHRRGNDRVGALNALRGNRVNHNFVRPDGCGRPDWPDVSPEGPPDWDGRHPCKPCKPCGCRPGPDGRVHATTDCPWCETCSGWPLFYTGPCGLVDDDVNCAGMCPDWMRHVTASAQFVATPPIRVSEDGNINFDFAHGDAELFREYNGRIRVAYPGRYLVSYTAQIPCGRHVCTRLAITVNDQRIFASEVEIEGGCVDHSRFYAGSALLELSRGDVIALESSRPFEIERTELNLPLFTMILNRVT